MDHERLKQNLNDYSCIAYTKEGLVFTSKQRGIAPLVELCDMNTGHDELFVADKIIGKAGALLCVKCCVKVLFAKVASQAALKVLSEYGVDAICEEKVAYIMDRTGKEKCPMEVLAADTQSPNEMYMRVKEFLQNQK